MKITKPLHLLFIGLFAGGISLGLVAALDRKKAEERFWFIHIFLPTVLLYLFISASRSIDSKIGSLLVPKYDIGNFLQDLPNNLLTMFFLMIPISVLYYFLQILLTRTSDYTGFVTFLANAKNLLVGAVLSALVFYGIFLQFFMPRLMESRCADNPKCCIEGVYSELLCPNK